MWLPFSRYISATPLSARLMASVPPDVKTSSFGSRAPISAASCSRARSTAASASQPNGWLRLAGCPNFSVKYGSIASTTRGSAGVVDCESMKIGNFNAIDSLSSSTLCPDHEQLRHVGAVQLGQTHRVEHPADRRLDLLHGPSKVAVRHLRAFARRLETADDVDRPLQRPDHVPDGDLAGASREEVSTLRAILTRDQPLLREALQDLGEKLRRDVELVRDPLGAHHAAILVDRDVVDRHQPVVRSLREPQHPAPPSIPDDFYRRPLQSEFGTPGGSCQAVRDTLVKEKRYAAAGYRPGSPPSASRSSRADSSGGVSLTKMPPTRLAASGWTTTSICQ